MNVNNLINNLPYAMQNSYTAALTVVAANILITEVAVRIGALVFETFYHLWELEMGKTTRMAIMTRMTIIDATATMTTFASAVGMNIALNRIIKFPFNPWVTTGLTTLTAVSCVLIRNQL